jgi:hypothetical protein
MIDPEIARPWGIRSAVGEPVGGSITPLREPLEALRPTGSRSSPPIPARDGDAPDLPLTPRLAIETSPPRFWSRPLRRASRSATRLGETVPETSGRRAGQVSLSTPMTSRRSGAPLGVGHGPENRTGEKSLSRVLVATIKNACRAVPASRCQTGSKHYRPTTSPDRPHPHFQPTKGGLARGHPRCQDNGSGAESVVEAIGLCAVDVSGRRRMPHGRNASRCSTPSRAGGRIPAG